MPIEKKKKILRYARRTGIIVLTLLVSLVIALYCIMLVLAKGPSPTARDLFVRSVMETSAAKFLARMYFSEDEINEILNTGGDEGIQSDPGLIQIPEKNDGKRPPFGTFETAGPGGEETGGTTTPPDPTEDDTVEVIDIKGPTYDGKMILVHDPARVKVGLLPAYGDGYSGKALREFIADTGALGGINAGGFYDPNGGGSGAIPDGIVIRDGKIVWGYAGSTYRCVIGFDKNHVMHVGNMTGQAALDAGIVDGLSFSTGPVLIVNGVPESTKRKLGGGLNPRTAIGQCADGTVLLLVVNGRQANSIGATYDDLCAIMAEYGAVNAANLDGGSSSLMIYKGETLTTSSYLFGERKLPDAFLIMP